MYDLSDNNCLIGEHIATNTPVEIPLNAREMQLFHAGGNHDWNVMCESVKARTGIEIIGQIQIDSIVINGNKRKFH